MSHVIKVRMRTPNVSKSDMDYENPISAKFWETVGISSDAKTYPARFPIKQLLVELELNTKPQIFTDLESVGLKIGPDGLELSIHAISELGLTLVLEYIPRDAYGAVLEPFYCKIFIPMNKVISINEAFAIVDWAKQNPSFREKK